MSTSSINSGSFKIPPEKYQDGEVPPIQLSTTRNLSDRLYDKRKLGALEIEQLIKELNAARDEDKIRSVIQHLVTNFSDSSQGNAKKGGLIALAATAIGLGNEIFKYIPQLIPPVLKCFIDQDPRVRYYACESLYNIAKVARQKVLLYFNEIFDALCKLSADPDVNVKNGAQLLDRLVKDIVTEDDKGLDVERFIPLLQERVYVINPYCRQFLIAWVIVLDSVPDIDMLQYLPRFLDGLFNMLKDSTKEIRTEAETCIAEFLREIKKKAAELPPVATSTSIDFGGMIKILLTHCLSKDELTRQTALEWVNEFIVIGKEQLLPFSPLLLTAILPCLSHEVQDIKEAATRANNGLLNLIIGSPLSMREKGATTNPTSPLTEDTAGLAIGDILQTITQQFQNPNVPTRLAGLNWVLVLYATTSHELSRYIDQIFPALVNILGDSSDEVVRLNLEVLSKLSLLHESYFSKLVDIIVDSFRNDRLLLEKRGNMIITQLSLYINPERIYLTLANILQHQEDVAFAGVMIQTLNLILLTSKELSELRNSLKNLTTEKKGSDASKGAANLFITLYRSWSHNAAATLSLCLLAQLYHHASQLVYKFGEIEVTVPFLLDMDKLVQLLESPVFVYLRLQLLEPTRYPYLFQSLYGLLMLLPQSGAFETLKNRLNCVSSLGVLHLVPKRQEPIDESKFGINFDDLLEHFMKIQAKLSKAGINQSRTATKSLSKTNLLKNKE